MKTTPSVTALRKMVNFVFLAVALFGAGASTVAAQRPVTVRLFPESIIESERIQLGNISSITGEPDAVERLSTVSLGYAPNPGMTREISREQITLAINAAGFSEKEIVVKSEPMVLVRRAGQILQGTAVRDEVENSLLARFRNENVDARIVRIDLPVSFQIPVGEVELRAKSSAVRNLFAPFSIPVEVRVDGNLVRTFAVTAEIEVFADVLVAVKDLAAGTQISETDVRVEKVRLERAASKYLRDTTVLHGVSAAREMRSGTALTVDAVAPVAVIKPGDPVRIEANTGALKIIVNGEARAAGRIGERIAVRNTQTGSILQAFVVDKGIVKLTL